MPDGSASLESALAIISAGQGLGGLSGMRAAAQRAVELEPAASPVRPLPLFLLGVAQTLQGDFADARGVLDEAVQLTGGEMPISALSLAYLARIALQQGDDEVAWRHAQRSHAIVDRPSLRSYPLSACTYGVVANVLSRHGDLDGAAVGIERTTELLPRVSPWWLKIDTRILLVPALAALGRRDEAATRLEEAASLLAARDDTGVLPDWHAEASRRLGGRRSAKSERLDDGQAEVSASTRPRADAARDRARAGPPAEHDEEPQAVDLSAVRRRRARGRRGGAR
jgi:ATP/maltotriose-dependent transcriptional regulator MalT